MLTRPLAATFGCVALAPAYLIPSAPAWPGNQPVTAEASVAAGPAPIPNGRQNWDNGLGRRIVCQCSLFSLMPSGRVKGVADKAKGTIEDAAGKAMDDKKLQSEGKLDKAKGAAHEAVGDVKDAIRKSGE